VRAAVITTLTGPDAVEIQVVAEPQPMAHQVLIDVAYAGVVFPDVLQTRGEYQQRPQLPFSPGWEVSGVVRADSGGFRAGDRVAAMPVFGGFAETVAVDEGMVFPLPDDVPFDKAAALPLNYLTAHFALIRRGQLTAGETVLVHGAAGGVGIASCQLAASLGARVIAVVSSQAKAEIARAAGADEVLPVDGFLDVARRITAGRGVDVVVDPVGGDRFTDSLRSLATEGRLLVIGFTGRQIPTVRVNRLLLTNTTVIGVASAEFWQSHPHYPSQQWNELLPLLRSGTIDPPIASVYPLDRTATAISDLDERRAAGRVLIQVREPTASRPRNRLTF
jgi:NADPH2:quinone reductase